MKKNIFPLNKNKKVSEGAGDKSSGLSFASGKPALPSNKTFFKVWLFFHTAILLFFAVRFFAGGAKIRMDSDLFNMLPKSVSSDAVSKAEDKLSKVTGDVLFILAANPDFERAKADAASLYEKMAASSKFQNVSFYQDMSGMESVLSFIQEKASYLLSPEDIELLNQEGGPEIFAENALGKVYGAFTMTSLSSLDEDPFLLSENALEHYLSFLQSSGTSMSVKDGVLSAFTDGTWYVMIKGELSKEGSALASKANGVEFIYGVTEEITATSGASTVAASASQTRFIFSGTPFHSYKASTSASKEISIISTVSMLAVILVLLFVFKSPLPILWSLLSITLSVASAFMASIGIFGKMHVLTLVFGTSLIGTSIDYSLHYFINWKGAAAFSEGSQIRSHLFKGLSLSLLSTILCYFVLLFAPFSLLRQMSVFSIFGITSTFLTAVCIYPLIPLPSGNREISILEKWKAPVSEGKSSFSKKVFFRAAIVLLFVLPLVFFAAGRKNAGIENNLLRLYKMEGRELENEAEAARVLKYSPSAWFIVSGDTPEEVLVREEKLTSALRKINEGKENAGYICTSGFVPSVEYQNSSREAVKKLVPYAFSQYLYLGYTEEQAKKLSERFAESFSDSTERGLPAAAAPEKNSSEEGTGQASSQTGFIEIGKNVPAFLEESFSSAWLGEIDGKYYSVVLPVSVTDYEAYKALSDNQNVFLISKVQEINGDLDRLSHTVMLFFALVYLVIFAVLKIFYPLKESLKIVSVPLLIVLSVSSIFAVLGIKLEFFSITGMILVFGLGLDYVIYMVENARRSTSCTSSNGLSEVSGSSGSALESFAILLSFFTTLVSFGALALSHFVPVHMIGLSIFIGLCSAYLLTWLYSKA